MTMTATAVPHPAVRSRQRERRSGTPVTQPAAERARWPDDDVIDAGLDSFPASDPPSWSPLRAGAPAT